MDRRIGLIYFQTREDSFDIYTAKKYSYCHTLNSKVKFEVTVKVIYENLNIKRMFFISSELIIFVFMEK